MCFLLHYWANNKYSLQFSLVAPLQRGKRAHEVAFANRDMTFHPLMRVTSIVVRSPAFSPARKQGLDTADVRLH